MTLYEILTSMFSDEQRRTIPVLYGTDGVPFDEKIIHAKFFLPGSPYSYWVAEAGIVTDDDKVYPLWTSEDNLSAPINDVDLYGYGGSYPFQSFGYSRLSEIMSQRSPLLLRVERDQHWTPTPFKTVRLWEGI